MEQRNLGVATEVGQLIRLRLLKCKDKPIVLEFLI